MSTWGPGAGLLAGLVAVSVSPYLARLTRTVPDRDDARWWVGSRPTHRRVALMAVLAAGLGLLAGSAAGWTPVLPAFVALTILAAPLIVIDVDCHRLPDRLTIPLAAAEAVLLTVAAAADGEWHRLLRAAEGAAAVYAVLFVLTLVSPRGFGLGDVKLGGLMGGYLGWFGWADVYYGVFAGFVLGAVLAVAMLALRRATMKTAVPFGPMLIVGPLVVLSFGLAPSFG